MDLILDNKRTQVLNQSNQVRFQYLIKCIECGKKFLHEKDRLHHSREEHKKKLNNREHKAEHKHDTVNTLQDDVDAHMKKFSDNF